MKEGEDFSNLLSKRQPPFDQCFEVSLPQHLQIITICLDVSSRDIKLQPPEEKHVNTVTVREIITKYSFSSSVVKVILFALPSAAMGSLPSTNVEAGMALNKV